MAILYYKEKTSVSLNSELRLHAFFNDNWKVIPRISRMLNRVLHFNELDKDKGYQSTITKTFFYDLFNVDYPRIIDALESLGLLLVDRDGRGYKGLPCYAYKLTEKCCQLLADANREYLYKLFNDPKEKRKSQNRICKRGYHKQVYGECSLNHIKQSGDGIAYDIDEVCSVIETYPVRKQAFCYSLLVSIKDKTYSTLKHNEKDNRVWNPLAQLPSQLRAMITVNGWPLEEILDIRSCYPSLWALYVSADSRDAALLAEVEKYNQVFLTKDNDPKTYLAKQLGIPRDDIKEVLIKYFNGYPVSKSIKNPFHKFDNYLATEFPLLYAAWKQTDITQTGNNIGKYFETKLMLDGGIYKLAEELKISLAYIYDGFGLYTSNPENCAQLRAFIEKRSLELLGVQLVFVSSKPKWNPFSVVADNYSERVQTLYKGWVKFTQSFFKAKSKDWDTYRQKQAAYMREATHCFKVIQRSQV